MQAPLFCFSPTQFLSTNPAARPPAHPNPGGHHDHHHPQHRGPVTTAPAAVSSTELGPICDDCAILIAYGETSGMSDRRAEECTQAIDRAQQLPDGGYGTLIAQEPEEWDERFDFECSCCGANYGGWGWVGVLLVD